jgi:RNA polymerase sigma-70 factor (ECF subfamily)
MTESERYRRSADGLAEESFEDLFAQYEHRIFNLIYRMVGDHEEAVDLTSDTFVQALKALPQFRRQSQPYTWLYRIAVNLCKNHFRKKAHRARFFAFSLDQSRTVEGEEEFIEIEDTSQEPGQRLEAGELQAEVEKAIAALPVDLRLAVILRDIQGLSYQEIAQALECTLEAVKSRLFRARAILRKQLSSYLTSSA